MKTIIFPELSSSGGINSFFFDLLNIHSKNNIETTVVVTNNVDEKIKNKIIKFGFNIYIIPIRNELFLLPYFSLLYEIYYYKQIIKKINPNFVIANIGTPGLNFGLFFFKCPLVYIIHTYPPIYSWKRRLFFSIPSFYLSKSKKIYTVSYFAKNIIAKYWKISDRSIEVIYNIFHNNENPFLVKTKKKIVLTLGHLENYKNPIFWIEIAKLITAKHNDVEFIWLGEGSLYEKCKQLTKNYKNIHFLGYKSSVSTFYQNAYVYIQPSEIESLGIGVIDALSYGIPVIVSKNGGLPETVQENKTGFTCLNNENDFVDKISLLINNPNLRNLMGVNARKFANKTFHPDIQNFKIMSLYKKILTNYE